MVISISESGSRPTSVRAVKTHISESGSRPTSSDCNHELSSCGATEVDEGGQIGLLKAALPKHNNWAPGTRVKGNSKVSLIHDILK